MTWDSGPQGVMGHALGVELQLAATAADLGDSVGSVEALPSLLLLLFALAAGLAAAYGRELEAGRRPGCKWWLARLLLLPLLAISATTASEAFDLSRNFTGFAAAMLSLGGYDCLRLIEARWRSRMFQAPNGPRHAEENPGASTAK